MNPTQTEKVKRFANDKLMNESVKFVIEKSFRKPKINEDVYMKAARFMALGLLEEAWKEINLFKIEEKDVGEQHTQIGL